MEIFLALFWFALGVAYTIIGANLFVKSASWFSDVTGISKAVIGATVIAFATSAPEFFVSLFATLKGYNDISTANIVGSLICNLGIGFALIAICRPHKYEDKLFFPNALIVIFSTGFVMLACFFKLISIWHGIALMVIFIFFTAINIRLSKQSDGIEIKQEKKSTDAFEVILNILFFASGLAGLILGSEFIVNNAKILASAIGISEHIIGLTVVAIGTSLPEIVTTVVALVKKEVGLSVGNIIGSNVFDITAILAAVIFASGGVIPLASTAFLDMPVALVLTLIAVIPTIFTKKIYRWQGVALAVLYIGYMVAICMV